MEAAVRVAALVGAVMALALPAHALAANLYVNPATGNNANSCTTPADPCLNILGARAKSAGTAEADTIFLAPGTYTEMVNLNSSAYSGDTFVGSGSGDDASSDSIISFSSAGSAVFIDSTVDSVTFKDLRVVVPSGAPNDTGGFSVLGTTTELQNVALSMENPNGTAAAWSDANGPVTFDHVTITDASPMVSTPVLLGIHDTTISDSTISSSTGTAVSLSNPFATLHTLRIERSSLLGTGSGTRAVETTNTNVVIDSSVVRGGQAAVLFGGSMGTAPTATLRNDTLIGTQYATWNSASGSGSHPTIQVDSSILISPQGQNSSHANDGSLTSITCTWSDVLDQTQAENGGTGAIDCPSDAGNPNNNVFTATSSDLFVNLAGGDYHLAPDSPALETGSPAALAGDESPTDLDGNPRVNDGNFDCVNARDKGAYEFVGTNTGTPVPQITAPASVAPGTPVTFVGHATDEQPESALAFHWTFSDGGSASTQNATHTFATPGTYSASLDATDACGHKGHVTKSISVAKQPVTVPTTPDTVKPTLSNVSMTNKVFVVGNLARKLPHGTRFLFTLSEPAAVKIVIEQPGKGRRAGSKCRKPSTKLRKKRSCTRYVRKGVLSANGVAGKNSVAFTGRLKRKALKPGKYRARITAKDAAGNASARQPKLSFRIVRG
ncbi:MAG TPA: PKD domain-containing protein [Thermoleophilaceae bacterium]